MIRASQPIEGRQASTDDAVHVTSVLVSAFVGGDLGPWLVPNKTQRRRMYRPYFGMLTRHALEYGLVNITTDGKAVAVMFLRGGGRRVPEIPAYEHRMEQIFGDRVDRFRALDAATEANHPDDVEHLYVQFVAVNLDAQRRGYGSALLDHLHQLADRLGLPCYLESTGSGPTALYDRHGYQPRPSFRIAGDGPQLWPMWRPASNTTDRAGEPAAAAASR
ncbi:GNAT family N-acetyltransferase [Actinoplanes sp. NPDC049265]|uniref:GNAT family N-acetyltransferase n=1 Tax=Actinoplanes sp. NPDC049265 TaxID=3363902 RepID=UPI00371C5290